jgi:hypothetical protein
MNFKDLSISKKLNILKVLKQAHNAIMKMPKKMIFFLERKVRAGLHYSGKVHQLVKNLSSRHGYLRQGMVCWRRCKDNNKKCLKKS